MAATKKWLGRVVHTSESGADHVSVNVQIQDEEGKNLGQAMGLIYPAGEEPRVKTYLEISAKETTAPAPAKEA